MRHKKTWKQRETDSLLESWECEGTMIGYDKGGNVYVWANKRIFQTLKQKV